MTHSSPRIELAEVVEKLSPAVVERRKVIAREIVERYRFDRQWEPLSDRMLKATVKSLDEHLTRARMPTERARDVYLEAYANHGDYQLTAEHYVAAWHRLRERETFQLMVTKPARQVCTWCEGKGELPKYIPKEDVEIMQECPYCQEVVTTLAKIA
jgi:hypothetical protein